MSSIIARITSDKKLKLKGNVFNQWSSFENNQILDDSYELEEFYEFDDIGEIDIFVNYILNSIVTPTNVDKFYFDYQGNLIIPEVCTEWQGFDDVENIDTAHELDTEYNINTEAGVDEFFTYLFNLTVQDIFVDKFVITSDKILLCNEVLENQIL